MRVIKVLYIYKVLPDRQSKCGNLGYRDILGTNIKTSKYILPSNMTSSVLIHCWDSGSENGEKSSQPCLSSSL